MEIHLRMTYEGRVSIRQQASVAWWELFGRARSVVEVYVKKKGMLLARWRGYLPSRCDWPWWGEINRHAKRLAVGRARKKAAWSTRTKSCLWQWQSTVASAGRTLQATWLIPCSSTAGQEKYIHLSGIVHFLATKLEQLFGGPWMKENVFTSPKEEDIRPLYVMITDTECCSCRGRIHSKFCGTICSYLKQKKNGDLDHNCVRLTVQPRS